MDKKTKTIVQIAVFALFIILALFAYKALSKGTPFENGTGDFQDEGETEGQDDAEERTKAPDFTVFDAGGNAVKLSDHFGKPIVLNFWASWCPSCRDEMPEFNQVYEETGTEITFIMVDLVDGGRETQERGAQYIREHGFSFPVYYDLEQDAAKRYGISFIPHTLFIDQDGYIVSSIGWAIDEESLRQGIDLIE